MTSLAEAGGDRWRPLRVGLVNLFLYDDEEFAFHDGRLLLRGNNGTGKSKVLALTLPFLLDGEVSPHRVEPDGDRNKRMEWNLLLGAHEDRLGYAWVEFGRRDADGTARYATLGCGLRATRHTNGVRTWFFVTSRRVGEDLLLSGPGGTPLTRERLVEALDGRGRVVETAAAHRAAVNETLFGLAPDRYDALVTLLIQLRQPQLSKTPSAALLSRALTAALPPLGPDLVAGVAEAFADLERLRDELRATVDARAATARFRGRYDAYAGLLSVRRAATLTSAYSRYEASTRRLREAETTLVERGEERAAAVADVRAVEERRRTLGVEIETLQASETMDLARELDRAVTEAGDREATAQREEAEAVRFGRQADDRAAAAERARVAAGAADAELGTARDAAVSVAGVVGLRADLHRALDAASGAASDAADDRAARAGPAFAAAVALRGDAVRLLQRAVEGAETAARAAGEAARRLDDARTAEDGVIATVRRAEQLVDGEADALVEAARAWHDGLAELRVDERALDMLADWVDPRDGPDPLAAATEAAARAARDRLTAERTRDEQSLADLDVEVDRVTAERDRLRDGALPVPDPVATRDTAGRADRDGAPLYALVEFAEGIGDAERAGVEAALEASGLLDAWVTPAGALLPPGADDAAVVPAAPADAHLGVVLRPAVDRDDAAAAGVTDDVVAAVLAGIGWGPASAATWVAPDGRFRLGVLEGDWHKPSAAYLGRGARQAERRRQLAALEAGLEELAARRSAVLAAIAALARRREVLDAEVGRRPSAEPLLAAARQLAADEELLGRAGRDRTVAEETAGAAATARREAATARDRLAEDLRLPGDADGLERVRDQLGELRAAAATLWAAVRAARAATAGAERAAAVSHDAEEAADRRRSAAAAAATRAAAATTRRDTLRATVGAEVGELLARLDRARGDLRTADDAADVAASRRDDAVRALGAAEGTVATLGDELAEGTRQRDDAVTAFERFAVGGVLTEVLPDLALPAGRQWAPDPAVRLARRVADALDADPRDDPAWESVQRSLTAELQTLDTALGVHGYNFTSQMAEETGHRVTVAFRGRALGPRALAEALDEEVSSREQLLAESERRVIEEHLLTEVAAALQDRITSAEAQVGRMNAELLARPTSTGMQLRFRWVLAPGADESLSRARSKLFRQVVDAWSPEDREAVAVFLQDRIRAARADDESASWAEQLTAALDYRAWHAFEVERRVGAEWRAATGPASGGERVLAATIPLFAAAASHYSSAGPHAPRLVLLDEAFAGVDDDMRRKCLGLLAEFDLDVVMTSEREWACYPEVPGIAIAQLARHGDLDAVHVSRWRWDGRTLHEVPAPVPSAAPDPAAETEDDPGSLFAGT